MEWWTFIASLVAAVAGIWAAAAATWQLYLNRPRRPAPNIHTEMSHSRHDWPGWSSLQCDYGTEEFAIAEILSVKVKSPRNMKIAEFYANSSPTEYGGTMWLTEPPAGLTNTAKLTAKVRVGEDTYSLLQITKPESDAPLVLEFRYRWSDERQRQRFLTITI